MLTTLVGLTEDELDTPALVVDVDTLDRNIAHVAKTLRAHAHESGAGLIVMGAYGHSRLLEWILGGATRGMLRDLSVPVVMAH